MSARTAVAVFFSSLCACVPTGGFDAGGDDPDASVDAGPGAPKWTVDLFTGGGAPGLVDGPPGTARFNFPTGLAIDGAGNLYVADTGNKAIRKVDPSGNVTTVWTSRTPAFMDPEGVAIDARGNLYVSDKLDHCVYQVDRFGVLSAFAGSCSLGDAGFQQCGDAYYAAGGRTAADIGSPTGMVVGGDGGMLFVADAYHNLIRFSPVNTPFFGSLAGKGDYMAIWDGACGQNYCCGTQFGIPECQAANSAAFRSPGGLGLAPNGDLLVADTENCAVRRIATPNAPACRVSTLVGDGCGGSSTSQTLNGPMGVVGGDNGVVYASDTNNQRVVSIDPTQPLGMRVSVIADSTQVSNPWGLVAGAGGKLFLVDNGHNALRVLTPPPP